MCEANGYDDPLILGRGGKRKDAGVGGIDSVAAADTLIAASMYRSVRGVAPPREDVNVDLVYVYNTPRPTLGRRR